MDHFFGDRHVAFVVAADFGDDFRAFCFHKFEWLMSAPRCEDLTEKLAKLLTVARGRPESFQSAHG
jgi:hypothetical protein